MFDSLFDLPLVVVGPGIVLGLRLFSVVGLRLVRLRVLPRLRVRVEDSEFIYVQLMKP